MAYELPELPYPHDGLAPVISRETMEFHYGKHHSAYVNKYNEAVAGTDFDNLSIEEVISAVAGNASQAGLFNNAAQAWNHTFYWASMKPNGGGVADGAVAAKIDSDLEGFDSFVERFTQAGATQFGSGWVWLVLDGGKLDVVNTPNAQTPLTTGQVPLLTMDVWEHAYYLDYQNQRPAYIDVFIEKLINWDFVNANLEKVI